ncbi:type III secretion system translocon subunit SctE [Enterobacter asburiae]|uniref:type III secretion system translocon subunit SctE n=1 Tax=Enterobacter asburiae TaxID=61645 RepID=UPI002005C45C|nr:type III secretion system translocon subunit SctE [Enterobacter asburiae]MCK7227233.1 type III secretion system translocon subunit SctE [Enterobacter asburiae]
MTMIFARPISPSASHDTGSFLKSAQANRAAQQWLQAQNLNSQIIDNRGQIAGKKLEQENGLKNQQDNEKQYKKEKRHRILHAIFSFIAHVISLVMIVIRPVKSVAKLAKKGIKKALSKTAGKSMHNTAGHMMKKLGKGIKHAGQEGVRSVKSGVKTVKNTVVQTAQNVGHMNGSILKNMGHGLKGMRDGFRNFMQTDLGRLAKREAIVNGTVESVNGIGDGVTDIQIAKIKSNVEWRENNNELIEQNFDVSEQQKKQTLDNTKALVQNKEDKIHLAEALLKSTNDISTAFITHAA